MEDSRETAIRRGVFQDGGHEALSQHTSLKRFQRHSVGASPGQEKSQHCFRMASTEVPLIITSLFDESIRLVNASFELLVPERFL